MSTKKLLLLALLCGFSFELLLGQSPAPVIVPAATDTAAPSAKTVSVPNAPESIEAAIKLLEEVKAANEATLKKQDETLQRLDELQKAANQLKIYTQRS
jgi:hypothetical protein